MKFVRLALTGILCCSLVGCSAGAPENESSADPTAPKAPQATAGSTIEAKKPKLGESQYEEVTIEFDSTTGSATLSYTDDKGVVDLENHPMPYTVKTKTLKTAGMASAMPVDINSTDTVNTYTCRVKQGDRVIVETPKSPLGASCMWSESNF